MNVSVSENDGRVAGAYALSATITVLFNSVLTFIKEAYEPLHGLMTSLTGHHWITHGLLDVILFLLLGWIFASRGTPTGGLSNGIVVTLVAASLIAGGALGAWFLFF